MGKVLIILVLVLTAVFATIAFVIQNRSGEVPEVITRREKGIDHGNLYAYALNYGIKEISRGNVTESITEAYNVEVPALGGKIEDITYTFYTETTGGNGSGDGTPIHGTVRISPNNSSEQFLLIKPDGSQITRSDIHQYGTEYTGPATSLSFRTIGGNNSLTVCDENFNITNNVFYEIESDNMQVNLYNATPGKGKAMGQWYVEITALGSDFSIDNESYSCNGGGTPSMITYVDIDATTRLLPYDEHDAHTSQARIKINYGTQAGDGGEGGEGEEYDFDLAVFVNDRLELEGSSRILGSAGSNATQPNRIEFAWSTYVSEQLHVRSDAHKNLIKHHNQRSIEDHVWGGVEEFSSPRVYELPEFPEFPSLTPRGNFTAGWWPIPSGGHIIDEDGWYNNLTVQQQLVIDTGDGERHIRADNFNVSGSAKVILEGSGVLYLYVSNFDITGSSTINYENNGSSDRLVMYYNGSSNLNPSGATKFVGSVYAQSADISIGGAGGLEGHIFTGGNNVTVSGAATAVVRVIYAPNAHAQITGSGSIKGSLIADRLTMIGAARIEYEAPTQVVITPPEPGGDLVIDPESYTIEIVYWSE
jgi:hypothetical protein